MVRVGGVTNAAALRDSLPDSSLRIPLPLYSAFAAQTDEIEGRPACAGAEESAEPADPELPATPCVRHGRINGRHGRFLRVVQGSCDEPTPPTSPALPAHRGRSV